MPVFPRDLIDADGDPILPLDATWPDNSGPFVDEGATGRQQSRDVAAAGFRWQETFPPLISGDVASRRLLSLIRQWKGRTIVDVEHVRVEQLGAGGGAPLINGAGQTGDTLVTDGWPASTAILFAGDFIRANTLRRSFEVREDVVSDGAGNASVPIFPSIYSGGSPPDNDPILVAGPGVAFFKARIATVDWPLYARRASGLYLVGLTVTFKEAV